MDVLIMNESSVNTQQVELLMEDVLFSDKDQANQRLKKSKLRVDKIEENEDGKRVVYVKDEPSNLICG